MVSPFSEVVDERHIRLGRPPLPMPKRIRRGAPHWLSETDGHKVFLCRARLVGPFVLHFSLKIKEPVEGGFTGFWPGETPMGSFEGNGRLGDTDRVWVCRPGADRRSILQQIPLAQSNNLPVWPSAPVVTELSHPAGGLGGPPTPIQLYYQPSAPLRSSVDRVTHNDESPYRHLGTSKKRPTTIELASSAWKAHQTG
jgi:hypothetical protein